MSPIVLGPAEPRALADVDPTTLASLDLIEDLAPFERSSYDIQAVIRAIEGELTRIELARQALILSYFPTTADALLGLWENLLGRASEPAQLTLDERRLIVLSYLRRLKSEGTGADWQTAISLLIGHNWSYQEHDASDPNSPDPYTVRITLPFSQEAHVPTGLALTPSGGGALAADDYVYAVSALTTYGETLICTPVTTTVSASGEVALAWIAADDYVTGYNVYRGLTAGTLKLLTTVPQAAMALVANGDFEKDEPAEAPAAWRNDHPGGYSVYVTVGATLTATIAQAQAGTKSMQVTTTATRQGAVLGLGVLPAGTYTVSFWLQGDAGGEVVESHAGEDAAVGWPAYTLTTAWAAHSITFTTAGVDACWIYLVTSSPATAQTFYVDSVKVTSAYAFTDDGSLTPTGKQPQSEDTSASTLSGLAKSMIRDVTPAHLALEYEWSAGFLTGVSPIGVEDL